MAARPDRPGPKEGQSRAHRWLVGIPLLLPLALSACGGLQSALEPSGPAAREIALLWWGMFWAGLLIFLLVLVLLTYACFRDPDRRRRIAPAKLIIAGGIVLPIAVLSPLLPLGLNVSSGTTAPLPENAIRIHVTAHQWWWDIEYRLPGGPSRSFTTANEVYLPVGEPVEFILSSADVVHSLWLPRLAGKQDLIPGHTNRLVIEADEEGTFRGQCAEFCGIAHAMMAFYAIALPSDEFERWAEGQMASAAPAQTETLESGRAAFQASGCGVCHAVRGTAAGGREGPDLTHFGSRLTIAAGALNNTQKNIAEWIARNDEIKPGNEMPEFPHLDRQTRLSIAAYLKSLK